MADILRDLMKQIVVLAVSISMALSGCASHPPKDSGSRIESVYSGEVAVGEKIHAQILSNFNVYTEAQINEYLTKVGQTLANCAKRKNLPYRFTILYSDKVYATSAPGGFVYITTGFLNFLRNEAELAAVLAHEIGELQFKDARLSKTQKVFDATLQGAALVGPLFGPIGALATLGVVVVGVAADKARLSPEAKMMKADELALHYLVESEYDPQGFMDLMAQLLEADVRLTPLFYDYVQARPVTEERMRRLQHAFSSLPLDGKTLSTYPRRYQEMTHGVREIYRV